MGHESVVMIGVLLTTMVATKTISEWAYGRMMRLAKEGYTLERLGWPKKPQVRFEVLAYGAIGSFVMMVLFGLLVRKVVAVWSSFAFILLTDIFVFAAVVVPGLISLWKYHRRKYGRYPFQKKSL
jgi:hypothetical protein